MGQHGALPKRHTHIRWANPSPPENSGMMLPLRCESGTSAFVNPDFGPLGLRLHQSRRLRRVACEPGLGVQRQGLQTGRGPQVVEKQLLAATTAGWGRLHVRGGVVCSLWKNWKVIHALLASLRGG